MSDPASVAQNIISANRLQHVRYIQVVSMALLVADWTCLIFEEIEFIWKAEWGLLKILYLLSRYSPYLDTPLNVISYLSPDITPERCTILYKISTCSTFFGMIISEAILNVRTYALYAQSQRVMTALWILYVIIVIGGSIIVYLFLKSIVFGPPPIAGLPGCTLVSGNPIVFVDFAALLLYELVIVVLTMKKSVRIVRSGVSSRAVRILYRDSILFFLCLLGLSLGNVLVLLCAPPEYFDLLDTLTRVLHSLICCRIILHIRGTFTLPQHGITHTAISHITGPSASQLINLKRWSRNLLYLFFTESSGPTRTYFNSSRAESAPVNSIPLRTCPTSPPTQAPHKNHSRAPDGLVSPTSVDPIPPTHPDHETDAISQKEST